MQNIFNDDNQIKGNWVKWDVVGKKVQGTFTGKFQRINQLNGQNQWVYEIKDEQGELWLIGGKPAIDAQMNHVKPGQVVGFEFKEERASQRAGFNATKIIQIYANPNVVDELWLREQAESVGSIGAGGEDIENIPLSNNPQPATTTPANLASGVQNTALTAEQKTDKIKQLAVQKLGANAADPQDIMSKVMEKTGIAFIEANFDQILNLLEMAA